MTAWTLDSDLGPEVLVTQTSDVEEAKRIVLATLVGEVYEQYLDDEHPTPDAVGQRERVAAFLEDLSARVEYGRMVPDPWRDYPWFWKGWAAEGRERAHGETTAVRFTRPPYQGAAG